MATEQDKHDALLAAYEKHKLEGAPVTRAEFEALAARVAALEGLPAHATERPAMPKCPQCNAEMIATNVGICTYSPLAVLKHGEAVAWCSCGVARCAYHLPKPAPVAPPPLGTFTPDPLANEPAFDVTTDLVVELTRKGIHSTSDYDTTRDTVNAAIRDQRASRKPLQARIAALEAELAEARRRDGLDGCPAGTMLCYLHAGKVRILGKPTNEGHNCDEMGCGSAQDHVLKIIDVAKAEANAQAAKDMERVRELWANGEVLTDEGIDLMRGEALLLKAGG